MATKQLKVEVTVDESVIAKVQAAATNKAGLGRELTDKEIISYLQKDLKWWMSDYPDWEEGLVDGIYSWGVDTGPW